MTRVRVHKFDNSFITIAVGSSINDLYGLYVFDTDQCFYNKLPECFLGGVSALFWCICISVNCHFFFFFFLKFNRAVPNNNLLLQLQLPFASSLHVAFRNLHESQS